MSVVVSRETRRTKRSTHPTDDEPPMDSAAKARGGGRDDHSMHVSKGQKTLTQGAPGRRNPLQDVTNQIATHKQEHAAKPAATAAHVPLTRHAAKVAPHLVEHKAEEAAADDDEADEDQDGDESMREDSEQPGGAAVAHGHEDGEDDDAAHEDGEEEDEDVEIMSNAPAAAHRAPHAHHKHATAHLHVPAAAGEAVPVAAAAAASSSASASVNAHPHLLAEWQESLSDPCQEYADSIYQHLRASELTHCPDAHYMEHVQGDLTHAMRSILIDWMVEVAEEYSLASQSLFLAVAYLDRFLSKQAIDRSRLQLVGVTSLLLSAKYWEIYPPAIDEFVYISDSTYTKAEVLAMENALLTTLRFKLTSPTSWEFSRRFCKAANADKQTETLVDYLLELMLQEQASLVYRPSIIAASALFLALYTLKHAPWSERLEVNTGIRVEELQGCVRTLHALYVKMCCGSHTLRAIKDKYSAENKLKVAEIKPRNM